MCPGWAVQIFRAFTPRAMINICFIALSESMLCLYCVVYLTLSGGVVSFWLSLAKRWHWLLTDLNPPHRKLRALKWVRNRRRSPLNTLFLFHDMIELKKYAQNFPKKDNLLTISATAWLGYWHIDHLCCHSLCGACVLILGFSYRSCAVMTWLSVKRDGPHMLTEV